MGCLFRMFAKLLLYTIILAIGFYLGMRFGDLRAEGTLRDVLSPSGGDGGVQGVIDQVKGTITRIVNLPEEAKGLTLNQSRHVIELAINMYYLQNNRYPPDLQALVDAELLQSVPESYSMYTIDPKTGKLSP